MNVTLIFPVILLLLLSLLTYVFLGLWTYRDAKGRGLNAGLWTIVVLLVPSFIGLIVYLAAGRNQSAGLCPHCSAALQPNVKYCPACGGAVGAAGGDGPPPRPLPKTGKGLLIAFIICIALMVLGAMAFAIYGFLAINAPQSARLVDLSYMNIENQSEKHWHMSFHNLQGEKENSQLKCSGKNDTRLHVKSSLGGGKLVLFLTQGDRREEVNLSSPQTYLDVDLSAYEAGAIRLTLVADGAQDGNVDIWWD